MRSIGEIFLHIATEQAPHGSLPCDGRWLKKTECPNLFSVVGTQYGTGGVDDEWFKLPMMDAGWFIQVNGQLAINAVLEPYPNPFFLWMPTKAADWDEHYAFLLASDQTLTMADDEELYRSVAKSSMNAVQNPVIPSAMILEFKANGGFEGVFGFAATNAVPTDSNFTGGFSLRTTPDVAISRGGVGFDVDLSIGYLDTDVFRIEIDGINNTTKYLINGTQVYAEGAISHNYLAVYGKGVGTINSIRVIYQY